MLSCSQEVMNVNHIKSGRCPACGSRLEVVRLACPECRAEFPVESAMSVYDYLSEEQAAFLKSFLTSRGSLKEVQAEWGISYPTAKRKLDELLQALGYAEEEKEVPVMPTVTLKQTNTDSTCASDIIRNQLIACGGIAMVHSIQGKPYKIKLSGDGTSFYCDKLPLSPPYQLRVFDIIVDLLIQQGGRAKKGNGRNYRLGEGECTEDTVVGTIGKNYAHKNVGDSVFDPVFIMAAVLEWAGIAHNERGYVSLTADYRMKLGK